jgi:hypothetical protein
VVDLVDIGLGFGLTNDKLEEEEEESVILYDLWWTVFDGGQIRLQIR